MNFEAGKERQSKRRNQPACQNGDAKERQWNPTNDNQFPSTCSESVKSIGQNKRNGILRNASKESVHTESRLTSSLDEFVQKEIECQRKNSVPPTDHPNYHSMNMELLRLGSFHNFPSSQAVSTVRLARQGFYHSGEGGTTICFACGCRKRGWKSDDIIKVVHRNLSPDCPLLSSGSTSNIQIGHGQSNGHNVLVIEQEDQRDVSDLSSNTYRFPSSSAPESVSFVNNIERKQNIDSRDKRANIPALSLQKNSNDILTKARAQQDKINAFIRELDPLGINFDRPKYPSYSVVAVRVNSFADWPSSPTQTPRDLAVAGFLYAGYGDYTRCFFCGGGLRNWEAGDDPWTEHARWFPKCAFVRQNKGDEFVALVQIQHQELESMGTANDHQAEDQGTGTKNLPSGRSLEPGISSLPAFQSVLEMGYSSHVIQRAFVLLKNTKEWTDVKAEDVMEVIFSNDDLQPSPAATTSNKDKDITTTSCEGSVNANEQQTSSSLMAVIKESEETDTHSLIEENRKLRDLRMCKICIEKDASIAMLPCGHLCCCTDCAPAMRKCPICRQFVKGTVRTWLA